MPQLNRKTDFSEMSDNFWAKIRDGPDFDSEFNEQSVFTQMYNDAAYTYYADAADNGKQGLTIFDLFEKWRPVAARFVPYVLRGDVDDPLGATLDWDAEGGSQAIVRPLQYDSFANVDRYQTPSATGQFNIVPEQGQGNGATETATANEQAWLIFGYADFSTGRAVPYEYIQENVNDEIGVRRPIYTRNAMELNDTVQVIDRQRGPLPVEPGFTLDVDVDVRQTNVQTGLWPIGIEVIVASATEYAGVLG